MRKKITPGLVLLAVLFAQGRAQANSIEARPPELSAADREKLPFTKTYVLKSDSGEELHLVVAYGKDGSKEKLEFVHSASREESTRQPGVTVKKAFVFTAKDGDGRKVTVTLSYESGRCRRAGMQLSIPRKQGETFTYELDAGADGVVKVIASD